MKPSQTPLYHSAESNFGITPKLIAGAVVASFAVAYAFGTKLDLDVHTPFLAGIGNLGDYMVLGLSFGMYNFCLTFKSMHNEPINALSTQSWAIHFSSVFEFLFAIDLIWKFAETTDNPKWKGLTWGMLES
jgi:hypothetical protein